MKNYPVFFLAVLILASCVSTNKTREDYFGYNNEPKYEVVKKDEAKLSKPYVSSSKEREVNTNSSDNETVYIFNNYYPYPYDPRYFRGYDPSDYQFFFYFGDWYFDPFWDYYVPYNKRHHYVYYPYPYWDYYWWNRKPRVIYVPYDDDYYKQKERTVRNFGPSRGGIDKENLNTPTKEPRSSSRNNETKKTVIKSDEPIPNDAVPIKLKLPEKSSSPKETPKSNDSPKSEPNTKQDRSSTRPR
ncbi:MAG: hypothetical protein N2560_00135 [Ignavibacteria bacterium]|nr:hypothetical protein [Ignavibacteria bacterium]